MKHLHRHSFTLMAVLIVAGAALLFGDPRTNSQPYTNTIAVLLAGLLLAAAANGLLTLRRYPPVIAWKASLRWLSRIALIASLGMIAFFLASTPAPESGVPWADKTGVVALVVPLALAVQAALAFSPGDESALEILLACPRPAGWILLERIGIAAIGQTGIVLAGIALTAAFTPDWDVLTLLTDWLPPALLLTGIALYVTIRTHTAGFGVIVAGLLWFVVAFYGDALLPGVPTLPPFDRIQPVLWVLHPYLEPGVLAAGDYWLNRLCVTALGLNLIALAVYLLRNEEPLLLNLRQNGRE